MNNETEEAKRERERERKKGFYLLHRTERS
jgi:hypothetical protein